VVGLASAAAAALAVAVAILTSSALSPQRVSAAVTFSSESGYIVAQIANPYATMAELQREFAAHKLNITLHLVPVSPGSVGHVVGVGESQYHPQPGGIEPLQEGPCAQPECTIGLRIPDAYSGHADIFLGRPARPGESYGATPALGALAPGEPLHCSSLLGATVAVAMPVLEEKNLSVARWRITEEGVWSTGPAPAGDRVVSIDPLAPGKVDLIVQSGPLDTALQQLVSTVQRSC
jgi:hypothetical protein